MQMAQQMTQAQTKAQAALQALQEQLHVQLAGGAYSRSCLLHLKAYVIASDALQAVARLQACFVHTCELSCLCLKGFKTI